MPLCVGRVDQDHTGPCLALAGAESRRAGRGAVGDEALVCRAAACPRCEALGFGEAAQAEGRGAVPIGSMNNKGTRPVVVSPLLTGDSSNMAQTQAGRHNEDAPTPWRKGKGGVLRRVPALCLPRRTPQLRAFETGRALASTTRLLRRAAHRPSRPPCSP